MISRRILGRTLPLAGSGWQWFTAILTCAILLVYPTAVIFLGEERAGQAVGVVALSVVLTFARGLIMARSTMVVRTIVYDALAEAIRGQPPIGLVPSTSSDKLESEIARGASWVEAYFALTLPSLVGATLAAPVMAWLCAVNVGMRATLVGGLALFAGVAAGTFVASIAARTAARAWEGYEHIATLVDRALRGRAELRAHGLDRYAESRLKAEVKKWSSLEQRLYLLGSLTGWTAPTVAVAVALAAVMVQGLEPLALATRSVMEPDRKTIVASLLAVSALPVLLTFSRALRDVAHERPHLAALQRFVASARPPPSQADEVELGDIRADNVVYRYPRQGSDELEVRATFTWSQGESLAILGPNACGKTTLALVVIGLLEPTAGRILIGGSPGRLTGRVAYLPQQAFFGDSDTVRDAIRFACPSVEETKALAMLLRLLPENETDTLLRRPVASLSGGERRLLALGRVLLRDAPVIILDEPEASLDVVSRGRALEVLQEAATLRRLMILTHDADFANVADRTLKFVGHSIAGNAS